MDPETTCIVLPPALAEALMQGDLVYQAPPSMNWIAVLVAAIIGLAIIEAVRLGFTLWRDYL